MDSAYGTTFLTTLTPIQAAATLRERIANSKAVHDDLSEFFKELQSIEQVYYRALAKIAAKPATVDHGNMGIMEQPWKRFLANMTATASNHSRYAAKIGEDLLVPLANYERTSESSQMGIVERNLSAIAKSMEVAEAKRQKAETSKSKNRSGKVTEAEKDQAMARSSWDAEAPFGFEKLQQIDEARMGFFKDALVRLESSTIDMSQARIKLSETALASLLDVNPADEAMHFVTQKLAQGSMVPAAPDQTRPAAGLSRRISHDDAGSVRSSGGASSLKSKFGTLLGRNKWPSSPSKRQTLQPTSSYMTTQPPNSAPSEAIPAVLHRTATNSSALVSAPSSAPAPVIASDLPALPTFQSEQAFLPATTFETSPPNSAADHIQSSLRNVNIRDEAIVESGAEADAALDQVSSDLRAQSTISRKARGRRDIRNTIYGNVGAGDQTIIRDVLGSPVQRDEPILHVVTNGDNGAQPRYSLASQALSPSGDTDSIKSGRSGMSGLGAVTKHTEPTSDGVYLSVIETVSVVLNNTGEVPTEVRVTGEAALASRGASDTTPLQIQVQSPDAISRLVANTNVLATGNAGLYQLAGQSASNMTTLFKYQVQPDLDRAHRFLPILFSQKWTSEEGQTAVKLSYRLNPGFGARSLVLQDVEISVGIRGVALSCVAKPAGSFVKRSGKLVWKLNEVLLEAGQEQSLLTRFKTTGLAAPGSIGIRWRTAPSNLSRGSGFGITATRSRTNPFGDDVLVENVLVDHAYTLQTARYAVAVDN